MQAQLVEDASPVRVDLHREILSSMAVSRDSTMLMDEPHPVKLPILVKSLPVPARFSADWDDVHATAKSVRSPRERALFDEDLLLRIHFGGKHVLCKKTPDGRVVIAAGRPGTGVLAEALEQLPEEEYDSVEMEMPQPWNELLDAMRDAQ